LQISKNVSKELIKIQELTILSFIEHFNSSLKLRNIISGQNFLTREIYYEEKIESLFL
jgi:hypothetical protein